MKRVLLIYNLVPEDSSVYLLEVDEETFVKLRSFHGRYGNTKDMTDEDAQWIIEFLENKTPVYMDSLGRISEIPRENLDAIVITGFLL